MSPEQAALAPPTSNHPIFKLTGVTIFNVMFDSLHILDCDGVTCHMIANTLFSLVYRELGGSRQGALDTVWHRIQELYGDLNVFEKIGAMKLATFCTPGAPNQNYPSLSKSVKAAEARHLAPIAYMIAREYDRGTAEDASRTQMLKHVSQFYDIAERADLIPSAEHGHGMNEALQSDLQHYSFLASISMREHRFEYNLVPKCHFALHLGEQSLFMNPRRFWTYGSEDFVGRLSSLALACANGVGTLRISEQVAIKYRVVMHMRFRRHVAD